CISLYFYFTHSPSPEIYTLSLHDALPIFHGLSNCRAAHDFAVNFHGRNSDHIEAELSAKLFEKIQIAAPASSERPFMSDANFARSEEHTSELQSRFDLVCRLLLEKKKKTP